MTSRCFRSLSVALALGACGPATSEEALVPSTAEHSDQSATTTESDNAPAPGDAMDPFVASLLEAHGMPTLYSARVDFTFRGDRFSVQRQGDSFSYTRTQERDGVTRVDRLDNDGFTRSQNGERVLLDERSATQLSNSVNSVVYFAMLPLPLRDGAVQIEHLEQASIDGRSHERLRVTFSEEGGGDDHDDEFFYWFDAATKKLRYMAYSYHTGGGGVRFRAAKNEREIGGVTFFDYDNFAYADVGVDLADLPSRRSPDEGPALELLSEILLEDVEVHR